MKYLFINHTKKWWLFNIIILVILFITLGFFVKQIGQTTVVFFGFVGLSLALLLLIIDKQADRIEKRIQHAEMESQAVAGFYKFMKTELPLNLGDWAVSAHFLNRLVKEIYLREPDLIVECGSGTSTLVASSCLKDIGKGKIISLDHLDKYAEKTSNLLAVEELDDWANVITAPLKDYELDIGKFKWYGEKFSENITGKIDMLIIDGPPASLQKFSRYPAIPLLKEFLADDYLILLDDTNRKDEKEIVQRWSDMLNAKIEFNQNCRGYALITSKFNG